VGRLYLGGKMSDVERAAGAAEAAVKNLSGRES